MEGRPGVLDSWRLFFSSTTISRSILSTSLRLQRLNRICRTADFGRWIYEYVAQWSDASRLAEDC
jgi:hypothetical protein